MGDPNRNNDLQCLTDDVIHQFLTGELDEDKDQLVADHLENCSQCQRLTMSFLSVDDLCLPWLKASDRDTVDLVRQPADTVMIDRLKLIPRTRSRPAQSGDGLVRRSECSSSDAIANQIDKYEIVTIIDQGGMGTVYLGIDHDLGRECAIKVLKESRSGDPRAVERSQREMHAVGRLKHENIVSVLNAGRLEDGRTFLVMEFLRGSDLQSWVQAHGPLSPEEACRITVAAARGLQHAHESNLTHRDVKPSNLFLTDEGDIKVLDFGLVQLSGEAASRMDSLTETGLVLGTVDFMSPEQALDSRSTDQRSDIYSLGCTLAWLLSGKQVFSASSVTKVLLAHRDEPAPELETLQPKVPAGLNAVFQKMVAKRPEDRFQSMADVINALAPFTLLEHDEPVTNHSPTSETQLLPCHPRTPATRRGRKAIGWLSAMIVLGVIITLVVLRSGDDASPNRVQGSQASRSGDADARAPEITTGGQTDSNSELKTKLQNHIETVEAGSVVVVNPAESSQSLLVSPGSSIEENRTIPEIAFGRAAMINISPVQTLVVADVPATSFSDQGDICDLDMSPDGSELLVAVAHDVQVWDTSSVSAVKMKYSKRVSDSAWVRAVAGLSDGSSFLAVNSDHSAVVQSFKNDSSRHFDVGPGSAFTSLVLSDDAATAWAGMYKYSGGLVIEWDVASGTINRSLTVEHRTAGSACLRLRRSPDDRVLAAGGCLEGGVALIDTDTLSERHRLPTVGPIRSLVFSPDSRVVVTSGNDDRVRAWDIETGRELWRSSEPLVCGAMHFSPEGNWLYLAEYREPHHLLVLNINNRRVVSRLDLKWRSDSLAVDPLGRFVAAGNGFLSGHGNGRVLLWETDALVGRQGSSIPATASTQ